MDTKNNSAVEVALASQPKARASRQRQVAKGDIAPSTTPAGIEGFIPACRARISAKPRTEPRAWASLERRHSRTRG